MSGKQTNNPITALSDLSMLNVYIFTKESLLFRWDTATSSAYNIFNLSEVSLMRLVNVSEPAEYEIIENSYSERYMVFVLPDFTYLVLGPFLLSPSDSAEVRGILRQLKLPLLQSREFLAHHQTLPVHPRRFCMSLLSLLEQMYPEQAGISVSTPDVSKKSRLIQHHYQGTVAETRLDYRVRSPIALEKRIMLYVQQGNSEKALEVLDDINSLDTAIFTSDLTQSKKYSLVAGCTLYTRAVISSGIDYNTAFGLSDAIIRTIHATNNLEELKALEYEMVEMFCSTVKKEKKSGYSHLVQQVMEYINVNLTNKFTLADLGKALHFHPNYISNLFCDEVGVSLSIYIQKMRIEESKLLLVGTAESISAISNYYQFCNEAYYIKVFRNHENMTPLDYRNLHSSSVTGQV